MSEMEKKRINYAENDGIYPHYSDFNHPWPYKNFSPKELACKHCGEFFYDWYLMRCLQALRDAWGKPIIITSGHRCEKHNKAAGGSSKSQHLKLALDCACPAEEQEAFAELARKHGFRGVGFYPKNGFVHLDMGMERQWRL
ncbi:D-Ala-D-Ala carboxypeptidase family metallohydrolase [Desulfococcaceae bacterium OttesenSCG-928-F15]|nr:D-Ala-D-Ala carboxypeptidase family metallohydrolase [Desulfococcaceae bacterium OttesenSCG-928-F15]